MKLSRFFLALVVLALVSLTAFVFVSYVTFRNIQSKKNISIRVALSKQENAVEIRKACNGSATDQPHKAVTPLTRGELPAIDCQNTVNSKLVSTREGYRQKKNDSSSKAVQSVIRNSTQDAPSTTFSTVQGNRPPRERFKHGWQSVDWTLGLQVFSAFYDDITGSTIRLLGVGQTAKFGEARAVWCHIWDSPKDIQPWVVRGKAQTIEWKPHTNAAVFILCNVTNHPHPYAVAITTGLNDTHRNWLPVKYPQQRRKLSVCFPALNGRFNNAAELVQTIELDRILGAERFFIYSHYIKPRIHTILSFYEKAGIMEVLPWDYKINGSLHYYGQNIAANDCLYRNLHDSEFIAIKDVDEVFVPANHTSLLDVLQLVKRQKDFSQVGSIVLRNVFFWQNAPNELANSSLGPEALRLEIQSLTKIWRQNFYHNSGARSKQLVLPERIIHVGVHITWPGAHRPGFHAITLDPSLASSHHHHNAWDPNLLLPKNLERDDGVRHRLGERLVKAVSLVYEEVKKECKCDKPW